MTIEIVKQGPKKFRASCEKCLTEFTYHIDDVSQCYSAARFGAEGVRCPGCGFFVTHRGNGIRWGRCG